MAYVHELAGASNADEKPRHVAERLLRGGKPDALEPAKLEDIIATANAAEPRLRALVCGVLKYDAGQTPSR